MPTTQSSSANRTRRSSPIHAKSPPNEPQILGLRIAWPNGLAHYFGKFTSEKEASDWIAARPWLAGRQTMPQPRPASSLKPRYSRRRRQDPPPGVSIKILSSRRLGAVSNGGLFFVGPSARFCQLAITSIREPQPEVQFRPGLLAQPSAAATWGRDAMLGQPARQSNLSKVSPRTATQINFR